VDRIVAENNKFSPGQNLFYNIPLFANPQYFLNEESQMYINEYIIAKRLNIPPASSLDEMDYQRSVILSVINEEITACENRKREISNGK
jgi:hypothetical protein